MSIEDVSFAGVAMRLRTVQLLLLLILAAACPAQHYPMLPVGGAPHGILTMMQDSRSALWLGTIDDVYCFDGERFYSIRQYGFPKETPNSFAEDSEGGIWIGTQGDDLRGGKNGGGLYRYRAGHIEKMFIGDVLGVVRIAPRIMLASAGGDATGKSRYGDLYRISSDSGIWHSEKLLTGAAGHISVDHDGSALYPCPGPNFFCELRRAQIVNWDPHTANRKTDEGQVPADFQRVLRDRFGCIWFRAEVAVTYRCENSTKLLGLPDGLESLDSTTTLAEAQDGSILMLGSLSLGRPGNFQSFGRHLGMPGMPTAALLTRDGTIWIASADGLYRFMYPFHLEYWTDGESGTGSPYALLHANGRMYAGSNGIVILDKDRRSWTQVPAHNELGTVTALAGGADRTVYAASVLRGIEQISADGRLIAASTPGPGVGGAALAFDGAGRVWLGGDNGPVTVVRQGKRFTFVTESVNKQVVMNMAYDAVRDALWACYGKEVIVRRGGGWIHIGASDGLLDRGCKSVVPTPTGDVWMAYAFQGLAHITDAGGGRFSVHNYELGDEAASSDEVFAGIDRQGTIWHGGSGVNYFASLANAEAGEWIKLDQQDGIPIPGGNQNAFFSDPDGSIWFGSAGSIVHFIPPPGFATSFPAPSVFVSGFSSGNAGFIPADITRSLSYGSPVTAHIGSLQFDRRNAIRLRYRLLPEQSAWQTASSFALAMGKLHWGSHRLQVQAQLSTGPWSDISEEPFTVLEPLWITWPAVAGYMAVVLSGGFSIHAWRRRRKARARKKFPELASWRLAALSPELNQLSGTVLESRFEVGPLLARGGFATVALGRDLQQGGLLCAIKVFRQELMDKDWLARRFQHEVRALAALDHPNVVRIYGHGATDAGTPYLVMEFIEGITLRELLEQGRLSPRTTASYLRQTGGALDEIHTHGICHRDLKPENLMVRKDAVSGKEIVLIDFSIAIVKDPDETMHGLSRAAGTLHYMAPEQAIGYADPSTDIYSLAKIVIEMLTGRRLSELLPDASMDLSERVRELLAGLPMRLSTPAIELLSSGLEFDPSRRPKMAGAFAGAIAADLEQDHGQPHGSER